MWNLIPKAFAQGFIISDPNSAASGTVALWNITGVHQTNVWDFLTGFLSDGGFFIFLVAITILYIGVKIALKYLRGIGGN